MKLFVATGVTNVMKQWWLTLVVVCLSGTVVLGFGAEVNSPKQVLIEFVVLEVSGGTSRPLDLPRSQVASTPQSRVPSGGLSYSAMTGPDLEATVAALTRERGVKVVQRPRIQTSDQTPATLCIGQIPAGQSGSAPAREPLMLGLTLSATPFIHSNGVVTMDLSMKQVTRDGSIHTKMGLVPVTTTREAQAKISVRDHKTILMAGLVAPSPREFLPILRSPKDLGGAAEAQAGNGSKPVETLLLVRPTLLP